MLVEVMWCKTYNVSYLKGTWVCSGKGNTTVLATEVEKGFTLLYTIPNNECPLCRKREVNE